MKASYTKYTTKDVQQILGLRYSMFDFYMKNDMFGFKTSNVGAGNTRMFTHLDVVTVSVIFRLARIVKKVRQVREIAKHFYKDLCSLKRTTQDCLIIIFDDSGRAYYYGLQSSETVEAKRSLLAIPISYAYELVELDFA